MEKFRISVRSLVEFLLRSGDIDGGKGGMADKEAMQLGSRIHRKIQGSMGAGYRPEVSLKAEIVKETFTPVSYTHLFWRLLSYHLTNPLYCVRDTSYILANISEVVNDFFERTVNIFV